jgi:membrane fusion protein, heavy metal efflux system
MYARNCLPGIAVRVAGVLAALALVGMATGPAHGQGEGEAGHMHGPDGRHIAAPGAGGGGSSSILSHHDLKITDSKGAVVKGCEVHSSIHPKGKPADVIHQEANVFEPENGVYGSHMTYKTPGEYVLVEKVTLPDKQQMTVEFPVWVPDPAGGHAERGTSLWLYALGGAAVLLLVGGAYAAGRGSARRGQAALWLLCAGVSLAGLAGLSGAAGAQAEEEGHMHGPDGRHIAVPGAGGRSGPQLRAFPTADGKESAVQTHGAYRFELSIENEEMKPDPDLVVLMPEVVQSVGVTVAEAREQAAAGGIATTGQVRPNPDRAVTVNSHVAGRLVRVGVTPGQDVGAGHVVAVIDSAEIAEAQAALQRGRADLLQAEAASSRARAQVAEEEAELAGARADADASRSRAETARKALARQKELAEAGAFSQGPVEAARSAVAEAEGELRQAQTALATLEAQYRRLEQGAKEGLVARKEAEAAQSAAAQGRTRVNTAERQLQIAQAALAREERIQREGLRNAREVQQAQGDYDAARLAVRSAEAVVTAQSRAVQGARSGAREAATSTERANTAIRAALNTLRVLGARPSGGSQVTLTTPIGGEVGSRPVNVGQSVAAGEVLATVLNTDTVWVESDVFEKDLARVRIGQKVLVTADALPNRTFPGTVNYVGAEVDPQTRAVRIRTVVPNPGELLKPNMFVRALIGTGGGEGTVTVPAEAVQEDGAAQIVFIEEAPGQYRRRAVKVGAKLGGQVAVQSGLLPGEKVVTNGAYQLLAKAKGG